MRILRLRLRMTGEKRVAAPFTPSVRLRRTTPPSRGSYTGGRANKGPPGKRAALFWGKEGQGSKARPGRQAGVSGADFAPTTSRPTNSTAQGRVWEAAPRGNEHPDGGVNHTLSPPLIRHLLRKCHHGLRKKCFLLTVHRTVRPPGEGFWRMISARRTFPLREGRLGGIFLGKQEFFLYFTARI